MTVVALASIAGSPGVTRLAIGLAAAWPGGCERVVIEADADGGRLGAELGVGVEPGLMELAMAARASGLTPASMLERGAAAIGDWWVVPAPPSAEQTSSALAHAGAALASTIAADRSGRVWIVDAGRLSARSPALPFARLADHVLLVTNGTFPELQLLAHRVDSLHGAGCAVAVVVVEPTAWSAEEIADFAGADVAALVPFVRTRAHRVASMSATPWRGWWRRVGELAALLADGTRGADDAVATTTSSVPDTAARPAGEAQR
ncbi:MAG: hypothetical protein H0W46_11360 [Acidimicrobiia bacterium]|nr:hypothetical protein [Acidimicrobiia bacterium]